MNFKFPSAEARRPYATEKLDEALEHIIPVATHDEIRKWFEERLEEMSQSYNDYLSRPDQ